MRLCRKDDYKTPKFPLQSSKFNKYYSGPINSIDSRLVILYWRKSTVKVVAPNYINKSSTSIICPQFLSFVFCAYNVYTYTLFFTFRGEILMGTSPVRDLRRGYIGLVSAKSPRWPNRMVRGEIGYRQWTGTTPATPPPHRFILYLVPAKDTVGRSPCHATAEFSRSFPDPFR